MTKAIAVRREGDAFQARIFWRKAVSLLDPASPVVRVGFESGPKGFDDVWVEYELGKGPQNQDGELLWREHIQCKWHVAQGEYGYEDLISPEFINANQVSLLTRARNAQLATNLASPSRHLRFKLLTNWLISKDDALYPLIYQRGKTLRLDGSGGLFSTSTSNSKTGKIRQLWCDHLGIDQTELRAFVQTLAFDTDLTSLDAHRENLDLHLENRGLRRIPLNESSFLYDELMFQWLSQGRLEFDRKSFYEACKKEGLLTTQKNAPTVFGVKSFEHAFDRLEDRCSEVLNLVGRFDDRAIACEDDWVRVLYPQLKQFLNDAARKNVRLRLAIDVHTTLAFAAGSVLHLKSGREVELEQRSPHNQIWHANDTELDENWPTWEFECIPLNEEGKDIALAISLTRNVVQDVRKYLTNEKLGVRSLIVATPRGGAGQTSVASGRHAFMLADAMETRLWQERDQGAPHLHLFISAPNAFTFFLGQRKASLGKVTLYEYDFEGTRGGTYSASICLPI